jgi:hypothetical protein
MCNSVQSQFLDRAGSFRIDVLGAAPMARVEQLAVAADEHERDPHSMFQATNWQLRAAIGRAFA